MVADDSTKSPAPGLSENTIAQLRAAMRACLRARATGIEPVAPEAVGDVDGELCVVLSVASREARENAIRPEALIVILKSVLDDLTDREGAARRVASRERLALRRWMVEQCVRVYFGVR